MGPGRWEGASLRGPRRSTSRKELKAAITEMQGKMSGGGDEMEGGIGPAPAQQAPAQAPPPLEEPEFQVMHGSHFTSSVL